jgi:hypothetical protein
MVPDVAWPKAATHANVPRRISNITWDDSLLAWSVNELFRGGCEVLGELQQIMIFLSQVGGLGCREWVRSANALEWIGAHPYPGSTQNILGYSWTFGYRGKDLLPPHEYSSRENALQTPVNVVALQEE